MSTPQSPQASDGSAIGDPRPSASSQCAALVPARTLKGPACERILQEASTAIADSRALIDVMLSKGPATRHQLAAAIESIRSSQTALMAFSRTRSARIRREAEQMLRNRPERTR